MKLNEVEDGKFYNLDGAGQMTFLSDTTEQTFSLQIDCGIPSCGLRAEQISWSEVKKRSVDGNGKYLK